MKRLFNIRVQLGLRLFLFGLFLLAGNFALAFVCLLAPILLPISANMGITLGSVTAGVGVVTPINQQYVPQFIFFTVATSPDINIRVSGDGVIFDAVGAFVNQVATIRQYGRTANFYLIQLAEGLIDGKVVTFTFTNQDASGFTVYADSQRTPAKNSNKYIVTATQNCLANSGADFTDFAFLIFTNAGATDRWVIWYQDGTQQIFDSRDELRAFLQLTQNSISASAYCIDNVDGEIRKVQFIPAASQNVCVLFYQQAKGTVDSSVLNKTILSKKAKFLSR